MENHRKEESYLGIFLPLTAAVPQAAARLKIISKISMMDAGTEEIEGTITINQRSYREDVVVRFAMKG